MIDVCPDCNRLKAKSAGDAMKGYCDKWYAIRDIEARRECETLTKSILNPQPLGDQFAKVLHDNLWDLYER